ncbi:MAG: hypothetical protein ACREXY_18505 [Gammaproteobacteria bacterium]
MLMGASGSRVLSLKVEMIPTHVALRGLQQLHELFALEGSRQPPARRARAALDDAHGLSIA